MIVLDVEQGTQEWLAARCGIPTASNFDCIVTTKGEPSKQAQKYLYKLAGERVSGKPEESYQNGAMLRGIEMEAEAAALYEIMFDVKAEPVGICYADSQRLYACSPDRLVGPDGGLEIKCPQIHTHVGYLIDAVLPQEYFQQVQGQLYVTGRQWFDFMSYYPGLKPFIIRVYRDEPFIKRLAPALDGFCKALDEIVEMIR